MSNMFYYLDWRADVPFSVAPFNDVDNLILAELAYTKFEGILDDTSDLSIEELVEKFWEIHKQEDILAGDSYTRFAPLLMNKMANSNRFGSIRVKNYIDVVSVENSEQVAILTFVLSDGTEYVAFRGTDDTIVGWKEDLYLSYKTGTNGQVRGKEYLNKYFKDRDVKLRVGGHSKGGNFAVYASLFADKEVREKIIAIYSNDGPGFRSEVLASAQYQEMLPRIISIVPENSMVGFMMENQYNHKVVASSSKGIYQHDAFSWQVKSRDFDLLPERNEDSIIFEKVLTQWLEGVPYEERKIFADSFFAFYEATGKQTLTEAREETKSIDFFYENMSKMSESQIDLFFAIINKLIKSTSSTISTEIKFKLSRFVYIGKDKLKKGTKYLPKPGGKQNK